MCLFLGFPDMGISIVKYRGEEREIEGRWLGLRVGGGGGEEREGGGGGVYLSSSNRDCSTWRWYSMLFGFSASVVEEEEEGFWGEVFTERDLSGEVDILGVCGGCGGCVRWGGGFLWSLWKIRGDCLWD